MIASHSVRRLRRNDVESYIQFGYNNWANVYVKSVEVKYIIGFFHLLINVVDVTVGHHSGPQ